MKTETIEKKLAEALDEGKIDAVKKHRKELGEALASGANACERCGYDPIGMLKTPGYYDESKGIDVAPVYEVGCIFCPPYYVEHETGQERTLDGKKAKVRRRSFSARANTPEEAVKNWNAGKYVEDLRFGINTSPEEERRLQ